MGFKSWDSYGHFSREVTHSNRYIYSDDVKDFLANALETSQSRVARVESGRVFWRAQVGSDSRPVIYDGEEVADEPIPFSSERMTPLPYEASEGRVNPKGIRCLYLATTKETAMAEVRPWLDEDISVARFKTVRDLRLINCSEHAFDGMVIHFVEPDDEKKEKAVWSAIDRAFSQPVTQNDKSSDYVPTQIIAELFKCNGFDGVIYRSSLSRGSNEYNVALFDVDAATMMYCYLSSVEKIRYSFSSLQ